MKNRFLFLVIVSLFSVPGFSQNPGQQLNSSHAAVDPVRPVEMGCKNLMAVANLQCALLDGQGNPVAGANFTIFTDGQNGFVYNQSDASLQSAVIDPMAKTVTWKEGIETHTIQMGATPNALFKYTVMNPDPDENSPAQNLKCK